MDAETSSFSSDDKSPSSSTLCEEFWNWVESNPSWADSIKEWIRLAKLIFVMVAVRVVDRMLFSAMKYLKYICVVISSERRILIFFQGHSILLGSQ